MAAGLTHCGFGGTVEFVAAGLPVLAFHHFGDQPINADLLVEAGMALKLHNKVMCDILMEESLFTFKTPQFTSD